MATTDDLRLVCDAAEERANWLRNGGLLVDAARIRAAVARLRETVSESARKYALLQRAVNESDDECLPGCDSYGHEEECRVVSTAAWLESQQKEIEALRAAVARLRGEAREPDERTRCVRCGEPILPWEPTAHGVWPSDGPLPAELWSERRYHVACFDAEKCAQKRLPLTAWISPPVARWNGDTGRAIQRMQQTFHHALDELRKELTTPPAAPAERAAEVDDA